MIAALDCAALAHTRKPIHQPIDDMLVPFAQTEALAAALRAVVPHDAFDFLVLAWHHDHLFDPSPAQPQRYHHRERAFWLACAEGRLADALDPLNAWVFDPLDAMVRASSLVEMVHSRMRPSLRSCKGQIPQEALHLILFSPNQHRDKSGKRPGKAPMELLTGAPLEAAWGERVLQQGKRETDATAHGARPSRPPLQLLVNNDWPLDRQASAPCQVLWASTGASEKGRRQADPEAAESFAVETRPH